MLRGDGIERDPSEPPTPELELAEWAGWIALFIVAVAVYPRIYFGFEFFDEAYYLALPYAFSLGHRPFLDEQAIHQLGALLIRPFVEFYLALVGSTEGLVLFGRHLYLAAALAAMWALRDFWRRIVGGLLGSLLAALILGYVPLCIFGLSYNTLTYLGLVAGTALLASACLPGSRLPRLVCGTACLAAVSFAYPPMAAAAAFALAMGLLAVLRTCGPEQRRAVWVSTGLTALASAGLGAGYLLALDMPQAFDDMLEFSRAQGLQGGGVSKWLLLVSEILFQGRFLLALALSVTGLVVAVWRVPNVWAATGAALFTGPALALASTWYRDFHAPFTTVPFVLSLLALAAPGLAFAARDRLPAQARLGIAMIVSTSLLAGSVVLWSSANGLRNAALGFTPAAIAGLGCLSTLRPAKLPVAVLVASLLAFQVHQLWTHAYREFLPRRVGPTVESGPWKGIRTTRRRIDFLNELRSDLDRVRGAAESIIFFDYFPAGYLMSDLRPRTPGLWLFPDSVMFQGNRRLRLAYAQRLRSADRIPDLVVRLHCIPARPLTRLEQPEGDPLVALFEHAGYETVIERECYAVDRRRRPTRSSVR